MESNILQFFKRMYNCVEYSGVFWNLLQQFWILLNILKISHSFREYSVIIWNFLEPIHFYSNIVDSIISKSNSIFILNLNYYFSLGRDSATSSQGRANEEDRIGRDSRWGNGRGVTRIQGDSNLSFL